MNRTTPISSDEKAKSWQMFDRIASTYDPLNHILSMGIDKRWRNKLAARLPQRDIDLLDLATGTGDQLFASCQQHGRVRTATGMDLSQEMLAVADKKKAQRPQSIPTTFQVGDATNIPAEDNCFDAVTISFGIRNVENVEAALSEMARILRPGGKALILEFGLPKQAIFKQLYLGYFRHILPTIGGLISGEKQAYQYLNQTVEDFPYGDAFGDLMTKAGFHNVTATSLSLGIAYLYEGEIK